MTAANLTCRDLVEIVTDYLEGALTEEERRSFESHVGHCPACLLYLEQMRLTIRTVGYIDPGSVPPEAREELLAAFRDWRSQRAGARWPAGEVTALHRPAVGAGPFAHP